VGLEGIRLALEEFIEEHPGLGISREAIPSTNDVPFERFEGDTVSLWKGDYFDLSGETTTTTAIGRFEAIYDRASIVAIEPELREDYVEILDGLLVPGGRILLVALERVVTPENASAGKRGPPYSIPEATLRGLFASLGASYNVAILKQTDQLVEKPEDRERYPDLEQLLETVYLIQKDSA
jgi:thiopurine S-methyltransferase